MLGRRKRLKSARVDTLIGRNTEVYGDLRFGGGLHVDGTVKGNVLAEEGAPALLTLSEHGTIEGEVRVPDMVLNGVVAGDVHATGRIELAPNARITGNVYYCLIEMAMGAQVNGSLVRCEEDEREIPVGLDTTPILGLAGES